MKTISFLLLVLSQVAVAGPRCDGMATSYAGASLSGNCNNGSCFGSISGANFDAYGNCEGGVRFDAHAYTMNEYVNFSCFQGSFFTQLPTGSVNFSGYCTNAQRFEGSAYRFGTTISGFCPENGAFSMPVRVDSLSITGSCR